MEVLRVGDPEDGRNLIAGQEAGRPSGEHTEVPYIVVIGLYTVLLQYHKVGVSFDVIGHIAVNTMCSDGSVVGVVYGAVLDVGPIHGTTQVEVDGITTKPEGLASISKLRMVNPEKQNIYMYLNYSGCNYSLAK